MKEPAIVLLSIAFIAEFWKYLRRQDIRLNIGADILGSDIPRKDLAYKLIPALVYREAARSWDRFSVALAANLIALLIGWLAPSTPMWAGTLLTLGIYLALRHYLGRAKPIFRFFDNKVANWVEKNENESWPTVVCLARMNIRVRGWLLDALAAGPTPKLMFKLAKAIGYWNNYWPKEHQRSVTSVSVTNLAKRGTQVLLLDLDNTLIDKDGNVLDPAVVAWIEEVKSNGVTVIIVSNTVTIAKERRLYALAESLGVQRLSLRVRPSWNFRRVLRDFFRLKPSTFGIECAAFDIAEADSIGLVAVAGDQVTTDIVAGNTAGAYTILIDQINPRQRFWTYLHLRWSLIEKPIRKLFECYYGYV